MTKSFEKYFRKISATQQASKKQARSCERERERERELEIPKKKTQPRLVNNGYDIKKYLKDKVCSCKQ